MNFLQDTALGFNTFFRAFRFVLRHGMGWVFLFPMLLWLLLTYGLFVLLEGPVEEWTRWLSELLALPVVEERGEGWQATWTATKEFLNGAREWLTWLLLRLAIAYVLFKVNKYLVLILLSPMLAYVSERTEEIITGRRFQFSWRQLFRDAWRGSMVALRNAVLELLLSIGIWASALFLPLLAPVVLVALFLLSSYFYGLSMFDYAFERRRLGVGATVDAVNARLGAVLANGACFSLLMKVPLLGILFAPGMAAVGAVLVVEARSKVSE